VGEFVPLRAQRTGKKGADKDKDQDKYKESNVLEVEVRGDDLNEAMGGVLRAFPLDVSIFAPGARANDQGQGSGVCTGGGGLGSWELSAKERQCLWWHGRLLGYVVQEQRLLRSLLDAHEHKLGIRKPVLGIVLTSAWRQRTQDDVLAAGINIFFVPVEFLFLFFLYLRRCQ
jgi:hypothetical protein